MIRETISNSIIGNIKRLVEINSFKRKWRKINRHNSTMVNAIFPMDVVVVGNQSYGEINVITFSDKHQLIIGDYVSIAQNVTFVLDAEHYMSNISTFPFKVKTLYVESNESFAKGDIIVDDDVWIGYGATIMSGVHIGQGAVVATGAVVTKDVPPYAIVGGVPAKVIKYRFDPELIEELLKVDYSKLTKEEIEKHIDELYEELKDKRQLDWMPKKKETK